MRRSLFRIFWLAVFAASASFSFGWEVSVGNTPVLLCAPTKASGVLPFGSVGVNMTTSTAYKVGQILLHNKYDTYMVKKAGTSGTTLTLGGASGGVRTSGTVELLPVTPGRRAVKLQLVSGPSMAIGFDPGMSSTTNYVVLPFSAGAPNMEVYTDTNANGEFWGMCPVASSNAVIRVSVQ